MSQERPYRLTLSISADSPEELRRVLAVVAHEVEQEYLDQRIMKIGGNVKPHSVWLGQIAYEFHQL